MVQDVGAVMGITTAILLVLLAQQVLPAQRALLAQQVLPAQQVLLDRKSVV
jgi:hypothetical protein